jgi:uncharacterized membrane protein YfhO
VKLSSKLVTPLFICFLTLTFFYKAFLGLIPLPSDIITGVYFPFLDYKWGNATGVPVHNPYLTDAVSIIYPLRTYATDLIKQGQLPLWNPLMFTGYPLIASQPLGLYFPTIIFYLIFSSPLAWILQVISQVLLATLSMYLLARHLKLGKLSSLFSAICYGFGGFTMIWLEWNTQATGSAIFPLLILFEDKLITTRKPKWLVLLSISITLQLFSGYFPVTIFSFLGMLIWFLYKRSFKSGLWVFIAAILGVGLSGILLIPVVELLQNSQRLYEKVDPNEAFTPIFYLVNLLIPDFFGNPATGNFWGPGSYLNVALFSGMVTAILAIVAIYSTFKSKLTLALITLAGMTLIITIDNPLSRTLYHLGLWGGSSMTMNRTLFLLNFSLGLLAGIGLEKLSSKILKRYLLSSAGVLSLLLLILGTSYLLTNSQTTFNISVRNSVLPCLIIISTAFLLLVFKKLPVRKSLIQFGLVVLLIAELFKFGWKFNTFTPTKYIYPKTELTNFLTRFPNSRFVSDPVILPPNMWVPYHLESPAGYDSVYPLNISKLIAVINSGNIQASPQTKNGVITSFDSPLLNILGTKYVVVSKKVNNSIDKDGVIDSKLQSSQFSQVFDYGSVVVLENAKALPRAYQTTVVMKKNPQEMLGMLTDQEFLLNKITLSEDLDITGSGDITNQPTFIKLSNNHTQVMTDSPTDSMLVVLDNYYPGWEAKIDGVSTKIHKVNYSFRGVLVPKGQHQIDFDYNPQSLKSGLTLSLVSLVILGVLYFKTRKTRL